MADPGEHPVLLEVAVDVVTGKDALIEEVPVVAASELLRLASR